MSLLGLPDGPAPPQYVEPPVAVEAFRQAESGIDSVDLRVPSQVAGVLTGVGRPDVLYDRLEAMIAPDPEEN